MHIFIDESGVFTHDPTKMATPSAVGALVIPTRSINGFQRLYRRLRQQLPKEKGEVKGRLLNEAELGKVVDILKRMNCVFEVAVIDLAMHTPDELAEHKLAQERALTANLSDEHHPNLVRQVWELRHQLETTAMPLYLQSVTLNEVIYNVLTHADNYYAFRFPSELGAYTWVLDAKGRDKTTPWEDWWQMTVLAMLQSKTTRKPFMRAPGGDYSHHDRFNTSLPEYMVEHVTLGARSEVFDPRPIMTEDFRFSPDPEFGLEAVDVLTSCLRRSLAGNFSRPGWIRIREIMIHRRKVQYVCMLHLGSPLREFPKPRYSHVLKDFTKGGRSMLPKNYRDLAE